MNDKQSILIHKRTRLSMNIETNENNEMFLNIRISFSVRKHLKIDKPIANYYVSAFLKENDLIPILAETNENENELNYRYKIFMREPLNLIRESLSYMQDRFLQTGEGKDNIMSLMSSMLDKGIKFEVVIDEISI